MSEWALPILLGLLLFALRFLASPDKGAYATWSALSNLPAELAGIAASFEAAHVLVSREPPDVPFVRLVIYLLILIALYLAREPVFSLYTSEKRRGFFLGLASQLAVGSAMVVISVQLFLGDQ